MAKKMRMVTATHRHCCAMPGCGNRTYTYFTRRDNPSGAIWLCGECVQAMNDIVCPPVTAEVPADEQEIVVNADEITIEAEVPADEIVPEEAPKPEKPRKIRGKSA